MSVPEHRYLLQPLLDAMGGSNKLHRLRLSGDRVRIYLESGMKWGTADRLAVRAGLLPGDVWESWYEDGLTPIDRLHLASGWRHGWLWREEQRGAA